jgi:hypothetical protein
MPSATYVAALVRPHLRQLAPLPNEEFQVLKASVAELEAVGRKLNQIARAMSQGEWIAAPAREELRAMVKVCGARRDHVKALRAANLKTWGQGHAERRLREIAEIVQDPSQTVAHEELVQALIGLVGVLEGYLNLRGDLEGHELPQG